MQEMSVSVITAGQQSTLGQDWNQGIESAKEEYLVFLRPGERLEANVFERMKELAFHSRADLVICGSEHGGQADRSMIRTGLYRPKQLFRELFRRKADRVPIGALLIARKTLRMLRFPEEKMLPERYMLPRLIGAAHRIVCLEECGLHQCREPELDDQTLQEIVESQMDKLRYMAVTYPELMKSCRNETIRIILELRRGLNRYDLKSRESSREMLEKALFSLRRYGSSLSLQERIKAAVCFRRFHLLAKQWEESA